MKVIKLLVDGGANASLKNAKGQTPKDVADEYSQNEASEFLSK